MLVGWNIRLLTLHSWIKGQHNTTPHCASAKCEDYYFSLLVERICWKAKLREKYIFQEPTHWFPSSPLRRLDRGWNCLIIISINISLKIFKNRPDCLQRLQSGPGLTGILGFELKVEAVSGKNKSWEVSSPCKDLYLRSLFLIYNWEFRTF